MQWWQEAVFYQIYPRSFKDSNHDGIGDLRGIISKLDYLNDGDGGGLGVNALWISPFFLSPMRDFGYDISGYTQIDPDYGSYEDCLELIREAHRRGMRVILDLVVNHCSDEHPWFREGRRSAANPKHDWFLWAPMRGNKKPNNWICLFTLKSAWHPNRQSGEWFLGTFTPNQPEFDWRNPELREAIYDVMRHWLEAGVDGFRLDVCTAYFKDKDLRSNPFCLKPVPEIFQEHIYDRNRPEVHEVFREMRKICDAYTGSNKENSLEETVGERVLIGEAHGHDPALAASCHGQGDELHMAFNFDFLMQPYSARAFKKSALAWYAALPAGAWPNFTLSNHDQARAAWRYRSHLPGRTGRLVSDARCRLLCLMLLSLRGSPFIYFGEEIGMEGGRLRRDQLKDPLGISTWPLPFGRDPERRPMQWEASPHGGFMEDIPGSPAPWLPTCKDFTWRNVAAQEGLSDSLLGFYKKMLRLRKAEAALREGEIEFLDSPPSILAYLRSRGPERLLVLLNFSRGPARLKLGKNILSQLPSSLSQPGSSPSAKPRARGKNSAQRIAVLMGDEPELRRDGLRLEGLGASILRLTVV